MLNETLSRPRPRPVLIATACIALVFGVTLYKWAFTIHWHDPTATILYFGFAFLFFLFVRALYRGRRWARGLVVWLGSIGLLLLPFSWPDTGVDGLFIAQSVLQAIAIIFLLLPTSRGWFSPPTTSREGVGGSGDGAGIKS